MKNDLAHAISIFRKGGIVIYPTDTAFGIGCRIDDPLAVDNLYSLRKRPRSQASPVLVSSIDMALAYFDAPSDIVRHFMNIYWPGALTIVAPCKKVLIYSPIRGGGNTIGLRMPDHEVPLAIIKAIGVPILAPSANIHGEPTPYRYEDLDPELIKRVDLVIPGETNMRKVSTVVDCSVDPYRIIRQGAIRL